jgi:hypothetical protein
MTDVGFEIIMRCSRPVDVSDLELIKDELSRFPDLELSHAEPKNWNLEYHVTDY